MDDPPGRRDQTVAEAVKGWSRWLLMPFVALGVVLLLGVFLIVLPILLPWAWLRNQAYYRRKYGSRYRLIRWVAGWLG